METSRELKRKEKEQKNLAKIKAREEERKNKLTKVIIEVEKNSVGNKKYSRPVLVKELSAPVKIKSTKNIVKLVSFANIDLPTNVIQYDAKAFTGWASAERFIKENYDLAVMKDLHYSTEGFSIIGVGEKIGYLVVTKDDAFKLVGGGLRLTANVLKQVDSKIQKELITLNKTFINEKELSKAI